MTIDEIQGQFCTGWTKFGTGRTALQGYVIETRAACLETVCRKPSIPPGEQGAGGGSCVGQVVGFSKQGSTAATAARPKLTISATATATIVRGLGSRIRCAFIPAVYARRGSPGEPTRSKVSTNSVSPRQHDRRQRSNGPGVAMVRAPIRNDAREGVATGPPDLRPPARRLLAQAHSLARLRNALRIVRRHHSG